MLLLHSHWILHRHVVQATSQFSPRRQNCCVNELSDSWEIKFHSQGDTKAIHYGSRDCPYPSRKANPANSSARRYPLAPSRAKATLLQGRSQTSEQDEVSFYRRRREPLERYEGMPPRIFWDLKAHKCAFKHLPWHFSWEKSILGVLPHASYGPVWNAGKNNSKKNNVMKGEKGLLLCWKKSELLRKITTHRNWEMLGRIAHALESLALSLSSTSIGFWE